MEQARAARPAKARLSSVANSIRLLSSFSGEEDELGITTLAARLRLAKSTVHRLAATLTSSNFLEQNAATGKYRLGQENPEHSLRAESWIGDLANPKLQRRLDIIELLLPLAAAKGIPLSRLANAWVLLHPAVTSAILGPRTMEQLEDSLAALEVRVTPEEAARIDELVPPGTSVL